MTLLDDLRALLRGEQADPWKNYNPDAPEQPPVTDEELQKAVEQIGKPKPRPSFLIAINQFLILLWSIGHFWILYMMIGTPLSGGIFAYVIIDLFIFIHYFILLNKQRKNRK